MNNIMRISGWLLFVCLMLTPFFAFAIRDGIAQAAINYSIAVFFAFLVFLSIEIIFSGSKSFIAECLSLIRDRDE